MGIVERHYKFCKICKEFHYTNEECPPEYLVYYEDDSTTVRACSHEEAAIEFAEDYNVRRDYSLMEDTLNIKVERDGVVEYYRIGARHDIHYFSEKISSSEYDRSNVS